MKATKRVQVQVHGMEGEGRNIQEAKADAIAKLEAATEGDYRPALLSFGPCDAIVWRELDGWRYRLIHGDDYVREYKVHHTGLFAHVVPATPTKAETIRAARYHTAQVGWQYGDDEAATAYVDPQDRANIASWIRFQNAYRRLKNEGKSDVEAHDLACRAA